MPRGSPANFGQFRASLAPSFRAVNFGSSNKMPRSAKDWRTCVPPSGLHGAPLLVSPQQRCFLAGLEKILGFVGWIGCSDYPLCIFMSSFREASQNHMPALPVEKLSGVS